MLNDEGVRNHHHQSYDKYTNWDGNSRSEDIVERVVHNLNMLAEMIGLMIYNKENMFQRLFGINTILIVSKTSISNAIATRRLIISIGIN